MTNLADAQAAILSPSYLGRRDLDADVICARFVLVVDHREFARECLVSWLDGLGKEFEVVGIADVRRLLRPDQLTRASAVIFSLGAGVSEETWLEQQVGWLRKQRDDVPMVAILESDSEGRGHGLVSRLSLQGYIPTSSTPEIARAALRLILVGGSYSPRISNLSLTSETGPRRAEMPKLTPRDARVVELLMQGMANKIIAYRLGMSQSTVKVHVHSIIRKFKVRNRTEVAVIAREMHWPR